ncbi:MAG TPA: hypothetical protein VLA04_06355 [Verrucomicrobiae bacterium]|nr:hypothetical protein [Verrucomicrobiae bacterium]
MARRPQGTPEQRAVESVLSTLWALLTLPFKNKAKGIDTHTANEIARHWGTVLEMVSSPATEAMAVSEADKLLDAALQAMNYGGGSMADRLRGAEGRWGRELTNEVWRAHKLRNQIAHEMGMRLAPGQAQVAIRTFATALRNLGVSV